MKVIHPLFRRGKKLTRTGLELDNDKCSPNPAHSSLILFHLNQDRFLTDPVGFALKLQCFSPSATMGVIKQHGSLQFGEGQWTTCSPISDLFINCKPASVIS